MHGFISRLLSLALFISAGFLPHSSHAVVVEISPGLAVDINVPNPNPTGPNDSLQIVATITNLATSTQNFTEANLGLGFSFDFSPNLLQIPGVVPGSYNFAIGNQTISIAPGTSGSFVLLNLTPASTPVPEGIYGTTVQIFLTDGPTFSAEFASLVLVTVGAARPLSEVAAALAKNVVKDEIVRGDYELGAKGFDWVTKVFVNPGQIFSSALGYRWDSENRNLSDNVLDCSGLVFWAYNKAFGATKYLILGNNTICGNPVCAEGADGQFRNNSAAIAESDLLPGDLLFFDFRPGAPNSTHEIDHVAMYVGCCGPDEVSDVVEAFSPDAGIIWSQKDLLKTKEAFVGFGRITTPAFNVRFRTSSPVSMTMTDPDGFTISPQTVIVTDREVLREIPGELYYSHYDLDGNGNLDDVVLAPTLKPGIYTVKVTPRSNALPSQTYSLEANIGGEIINLAQNVLIQDIPTEGYGIKSVDGEIEMLAPFSRFFSRVEIDSDDKAFESQSNFTLGASSNGIHPPTEEITLKVGTLSITIPPGSFKIGQKGRSNFSGVINGIQLEAVIQPLGGNRFTFKSEGKGSGVNLSGVENPVSIALTIGNDGASSKVRAEFD